MSCIAFAFSVNFWMALIARFLNGALNGNLGIAKAYLGQISTKETQARAFGILGMMWGGGSVIGGLYGGLLARPAIKWPDVFSQEGIFGQFPYLLPNLVSITTVALGLVAVYFFLKELPRSKHVKPSVRALLKNRDALLTTSHYALFGFITVVLEEAVPMYLMSSFEVGGLLWNTSRVGIVGGMTGIGSVGVLLTIYSPLANRLGMLWSYRVGLALTIPYAIMWPLCGLFQGNDLAVWGWIVVVCVVRGLAYQLGFAAVMALITNSVPVAHMGSAHGLGQSLVALMRTLGPLGAGFVFAWSVKEPVRSFPFNQYFLFFLVALFMCLILLFSLLLKRSLDHPQPTEEEVELVEHQSEVFH